MVKKVPNKVWVLATLCCILTFCVVVAGAYVRLSDAGLGCPDWPGCYGVLIGVPSTEEDVLTATQEYPASDFAQDKAWKEVTHRYMAGILGFMLLALAWISRGISLVPWLICGVTLLQVFLGMWTVTLLLKPIVVVLHLLGGMTIFALLIWFLMSLTRPPRLRSARPTYFFGLLSVAVLFMQIALGGWVSANYAALACTDFPTCQAQWWPSNMDFSSALSLWGDVGVNYEFGRLEDGARVAIHVMHRIGAIVAGGTLLVFLLGIMSFETGLLRKIAGAGLVLLFAQWTLGVSNVVLSLPLWTATMHNGVAALLLASVVAIVARMRASRALH